MPRPTIEGTVVRQIDMHHSSAGSNKDYRITISQVGTGQYRVYTEYGPAGRLQNGKELTKSAVGIGQATRLADEARDKKINQRDSYSVQSDRDFAAKPAPQAAPQPSPPIQKPSPARPLVSVDSLSPESRAKLVAIF